MISFEKPEEEHENMYMEGEGKQVKEGGRKGGRKEGKEEDDRRKAGSQERTMWQMASKDIHKVVIFLQKILFSGIFLQ